MSDPLQTVWDALDRAGCRPTGALHNFRARCPAHDSDSLSLSGNIGADGRVLLWCWVKCPTDEIVQALGLTWSDLFPEGHRSARRSGAVTRDRRAPIDLTLAALLELGITYRATRNANMWVAERCPVCEADARYPLWVYADERGRVALSCFNGCDQAAILRELAGREEGLAA